MSACVDACNSLTGRVDCFRCVFYVYLCTCIIILCVILLVSCMQSLDKLLCIVNHTNQIKILYSVLRMGVLRPHYYY